MALTLIQLGVSNLHLMFNILALLSDCFEDNATPNATENLGRKLEEERHSQENYMRRSSKVPTATFVMNSWNNRGRGYRKLTFAHVRQAQRGVRCTFQGSFRFFFFVKKGTLTRSKRAWIHITPPHDYSKISQVDRRCQLRHATCPPLFSSGASGLVTGRRAGKRPADMLGENVCPIFASSSSRVSHWVNV